MGLEEVSSNYGTNVASSDFVKSSQTSDRSNLPYGITGSTKTTMQVKQDRKNEKDRHPVAKNSNDPASSETSASSWQQTGLTSASASVAPLTKMSTKKLFVGGLPTDITDPEFREFFSQFGELHESVVMFDRETHRSRGFGFVTYVNPDVSKSLLQMGSHGDGIGRLVMRGKTCEVKAAAPRGQAPTRGGRGNRSNRSASRSHQQAQVHQVTSFGHSEQFPIMYQNENYSMPYPQGLYPSAPNSSGYTPPVYHHAMPPLTHPQLHVPPHESNLLAPDRDPRGGGIAPYFFAPPMVTPPPNSFSVPNTFSPAPQIPGNHQPQGFAYAPYVSNHVQSTHQLTEMETQPMESMQQRTEKDEGVTEIQK